MGLRYFDQWWFRRIIRFRVHCWSKASSPLAVKSEYAKQDKPLCLQKCLQESVQEIRGWA